MSRTVWEAIFLLVILKIPIAYLCWVVWYAIKAEPKPPCEPALRSAPPELDLDPRAGWRPRFARPRQPAPGPHGAPRRTYARRAAFARAETRR
jgi:hypothetical protein